MSSYPDDYEPPTEYVDGFSAVMCATEPYALGGFDLGCVEDRLAVIDYLRGVCDGVEAAFTTGIDRLELARSIAAILAYEEPETEAAASAENANP